ncbi:MAG: isocitrate lyase/PEP mutase family protein [Nannocystales bacterium]
MATQQEKARAFLAAHHSNECMLIPNAWDGGSARMLEAAGFPAILTTSAGIAFSMGRPDYCDTNDPRKLPRETMLQRLAEIVRAVDVPVSADLEAGYGETPSEVAQTIRMAIDVGLVGCNLEDVAGATSELFPVDAASARIRAAREAADGTGVPLVINARTDAFLVGSNEPLAESIRRCNRYRAAGADCVFVPGVVDPETIGTLVREIDAPVSVVMGLLPDSLDLARLHALGVRRVSVGGSLARMALASISRAAEELKSRGTFGYAADQMSTGELNRLFGAAS